MKPDIHNLYECYCEYISVILIHFNGLFEPLTGFHETSCDPVVTHAYISYSSYTFFLILPFFSSLTLILFKAYITLALTSLIINLFLVVLYVFIR
jgi:hypothetical protein